MPVTASSFHVNGADANDTDLMNLALTYLQNSPTAAPLLQQAAAAGVQITIAHDGTDQYNGAGTITWDPNAAHITTQQNEAPYYASGTQSAALALLHEIAHALDPNYAVNATTEIPVYDTEAERHAINIEDQVAAELGEPQRYNHLSAGTPGELNSSEHTDTSTNTYVQVDAGGNTEQGPAVTTTTPQRLPDYGTDYDIPGCVEVTSVLPDGQTAGSVKVGDTMELADQATLEAGTGEVTYSVSKPAPGWRIVTESGASLRCSASAPIPTPGGLLTPAELLGKFVAVRDGTGSAPIVRWERVVEAHEIGIITVQHITVGNKCFWAGEKKNKFILHHNLKPVWTGYDDPPVDVDYTAYSDQVKTVGHPAHEHPHFF